MIRIKSVSMAPNPVSIKDDVKIEVELYMLYPSPNLYPSATLYPQEDIRSLYPAPDVYPSTGLYPRE